MSVAMSGDGSALSGFCQVRRAARPIAVLHF
jgi:hypothetical protein